MVGLTLFFGHDLSGLRVWSAFLQRALSFKLENFYKVCELVGEGPFAKVYKGIDRRTGCKVAIKVTQSEQGKRKRSHELRPSQEAEIVRSICHKNIVRTFDVFETSNEVSIVMEFMEKGSLKSFLEGNRKRISERNGKRIARQLLSGVAYLHENGIIHRDLCVDNILVSGDGTVKISDFQFARWEDRMGPADYYPPGLCGCMAYGSPEIIAECKHNKQVDIFACGVLMYMAIAGFEPHRGRNFAEVRRSIMGGRWGFPPKYWWKVSMVAREIVDDCLSVHPWRRPTAEDALKHRWFEVPGDREVERVGWAGTPVPFVRNGRVRALEKVPGAFVHLRRMESHGFRRGKSFCLNAMQREG
ncbi:Serine/threonine protein kinase [Gracilaria domingensis]|nr:Serine/threonine protein kinase [Gracilaria domingensis]